MNKKAIAILGAIFILIVGTLGFLIYSKYSSKTPEVVVNNNGNASVTPTGLISPTPTPVLQSNIVNLTGDQVISPILFFSGTGIDYFDHQGNLYQALLQNSNGQMVFSEKKQLAIPSKSGITKILWSPKTQDFIAQFLDSTGSPRFSYFNYKLGQYIDLPPQIISIDWAPSGEQVYYVWLQDNKATLSIASPDAKDYKVLTELWEPDNEIHVSPDGTQILYFETNNSGVNNSINSVTSDGKVFKGLVKNGQNYGVLWSPDSQKFVFAKKDINSQGYQLWVYNLTSGAVMSLGVMTTVDKVVWDGASTYVYASVPNSPPTASNALTLDKFYRVDINTLEKKQYPQDAATPVDGRDLLISTSGDKLFFRNAQDGGLYYLDLTQ
jgi:hypothetical protein